MGERTCLDGICVEASHSFGKYIALSFPESSQRTVVVKPHIRAWPSAVHGITLEKRVTGEAPTFQHHPLLTCSNFPWIFDFVTLTE